MSQLPPASSTGLPPRSHADDPIVPSPSAPTPAAASVWEDFIDIFYAPASVFARRATSGFGIPMLVVTLLVGGIFVANRGVLQPVMDGEFRRAMAVQMKNNPQMTPEMMTKAQAIGEKFTMYGTFVFIPLTILCIGLVLWLVGKFVEAKQTLAAAIMVATYSYFPRVIESVLSGVQGLVLDPSTLNGRYRLTLGVGRFFDPDVASPLLLAVVGRLDLFTIWVTVLLAIGLSVTGKIPRQRAAIAAAIVWAVGALPAVLGALRN